MIFVNSPKPEYAADGRPKERLDKRQLLFRLLILVVILIGLSLNGYGLAQPDMQREFRRRNGNVQGVITDGAGKPITGALVFLTGSPEEMGTTDENGRFAFTKVPNGEQSVIVVKEDIGQQYFVDVEANALTDMGELSYTAPPEKWVNQTYE